MGPRGTTLMTFRTFKKTSELRGGGLRHHQRRPPFQTDLAICLFFCIELPMMGMHGLPELKSPPRGARLNPWVVLPAQAGMIRLPRRVFQDSLLVGRARRRCTPPRRFESTTLTMSLLLWSLVRGVDVLLHCRKSMCRTSAI